MIKTRSSALYSKVLQINCCIGSVSQCWESLHWLPLVITRFPSVTNGLVHRLSQNGANQWTAWLSYYWDEELRFMYKNSQGHLTVFCIVFVWLRGPPSPVRIMTQVPWFMYQNRLGPSGGIYHPSFAPCFVVLYLNYVLTKTCSQLQLSNYPQPIISQVIFRLYYIQVYCIVYIDAGHWHKATNRCYAIRTTTKWHRNSMTNI